MKYKYIFGPINSRRFGISLGIDLSPDKKNCNFDCLYCELSVAKLSSKIEDEADAKDIIKELKLALDEFRDIDVITITANGEPTLYSHLKELVEEINKIKEDKKVLILSNASTINKKEVQDALMDIDIVKLSLDCATKECFKKIDRSMDDIDLEDIIEGMSSFAKRYKGVFVIEILIVKGINDKKEQIEELNRVLKEIQPDRIDLGSIDRPPAYSVEGVSEERLRELSSYFRDLPVNIVYKKEPKIKIDMDKDELFHTLSMRSYSQMDVDLLLSKRAVSYLKELLDEKRIKKVDIGGVSFYQSSLVKQKRRS